MKRSIVWVILFVMSLTMSAQTYSDYWKEVREAASKDLPKTQIAVLDKIVAKASGEHNYGQLLAAQMKRGGLQANISPDSMGVEVERLKQVAVAAEASNPTLATVYAAAIAKIMLNASAPNLEWNDDDAKGWKAKALAHPELLAAQTCEGYRPFVYQRKDSEVFGYDLLHVVAHELDSYETMYNYYRSVGNRQATCMAAALLLRSGQKGGSRAENMQWVDSLLNEYGDMPVACELAIERVSLMESKATAEERIKYIDHALGKWGSWPHANALRNKRSTLVNPQFEVVIDRNLTIPYKAHTVKLKDIRHMDEVKLTVSRLRIKGDTQLLASYEDDYQKLVKLISERDVQTVSRSYADRKDYELFNDSLLIGPLPVGAYLLDFYANGKRVENQSRLFYVSNLYVMAEELPGKTVRYVAVNATTGQPLSGVSIRLRNGSRYGKPSVEKVLTTDAKGEALYAFGDTSLDYLYAYTDNDQSCPEYNVWTSYSYSKGLRQGRVARIYTDRSIYRPGQTVQVSTIVFDRGADGLTMTSVDAESVTFRLYDANNKEVGKQIVTTDNYGTAATEFTLPSDGLTGRFQIQARVSGATATASFRVEEYKRPTFQVDIPDYEGAYGRGDTITVKGFAKSYAGVPVQGAKVKYTVNRQHARWCWWFHSDDDDVELDKGEAVTDTDGCFLVKVPMLLPTDVEDEEDLRGVFYQFVVNAQVTDQGGESHEGSLSLPLGTKATSFSCSIPQKSINTTIPKVTFSLRNASGQDVGGDVVYQIDGGAKRHVKTGEAVAVSDRQLATGKHKLTAVCGKDKLEQEFIVFSVDDKRPVVETHDWFYASSMQFPSDGKPIYVQIGSSDPDQHIVYSIFSGDKVLESGAIDQSNALTTRTFIYKEEYGDGLKMVFAWVKDGQFYSHSTQISRPMPDKRLKLEWKTFRDKLIPGQQEEWTLLIKNPDGTPAKAQLLATMYDQSLDQINSHSWSFSLPFVNYMPSASWVGRGSDKLSAAYYNRLSYIPNGELSFSTFESEYISPFIYYHFGYQNTRVRGGLRMRKMAGATVDMMVMDEPMPLAAPVAEREAKVALYDLAEESSDNASLGETTPTSNQVRENLNETAFFYPRLLADENGAVAIRFTLPESLTTWKFMGIAHDETMNNGSIYAEVIGQKTVMVQPNIPRFVREGDAAQIAVRLINTSEKQVGGTARLELIDPVTEKTLASFTQGYTIDANGTSNAVFEIPVNNTLSAFPLLVARVMAAGDGYSDGEQHYLPVLPNQEQVINTRPFTQHEPGTMRIDLKKLFPEGSSQKRLTVEYTNNPAWLMVQALPYVGDVNEKNAISLVTAYYANSLTNYIMHTSPSVKRTLEQWSREKGEETTLMSSLQKDQKLKELVLNETPWVLDADNEREQKQSLRRFFDENNINCQLSTALAGLKKLQKSNGGWTWWEGMDASPYMTMNVCMTLVRLNSMIGKQNETQSMIDKAFSFIKKEIAEEVKELKKYEKKGFKNLRPSELAVDYLYTLGLDGRQLTGSAKADKDYLVALMAKKTTELTIYGKANTAIILAANGYRKKALEYLQSIKEYSVFTEEMGRYFDTRKAYYSWYDYRIPTETAAIEALKTITPEDKKTIEEMQRWLLQAKRTQAWDTPINSVNAIFAFAEQGSIRQLAEQGEETVLRLDGTPMELPTSTAGVGYVKASVDNPSATTFTAEKTTPYTSWGAVYAQFMQPVTEIEDATSGIQVKRELLKDGKPVTKLAVGDRVTVRLILRADRDYDFVQVVDKRAACMEPVGQISGYHWGYYCAPKDYTTNYYFDRLPKGTRVIETDYYIDRAGVYQMGTCTAQCAYSPEYTGRKKGERLNVVAQ